MDQETTRNQPPNRKHRYSPDGWEPVPQFPPEITEEFRKRQAARKAKKANNEAKRA